MMDFDTVFSSDSIQTLQCSICENFLSYFPIYISSDYQSICGRCTVPQEHNCIRNVTYEAVVKFLKFPCRYKNEGCIEKTLTQNIPQHERNCPYRIIKCSTVNFTQCNWTGASLNLFQHCQDTHFDKILKDGEFEMDLSQSHQFSNFLESDNVLLIFTRKFDSVNNTLQCSICYFEGEINAKNRSFQISIKCGKKVFSEELQTTTFDEVYFTDIFLDWIGNRSNYNKSIVFGKITVGNDIHFEKERNIQMLSIIKCCVCSDYVIPPIYQCLKEQAVRCSGCKEKHCKTCTTCMDAETRNFNLDRMASLLNYPCKYQTSGCNVIFTPEKINMHQAICPYAKYDCPIRNISVRCEWNGFEKDMTVHIQKAHAEIITCAEEITFPLHLPVTKANSKDPRRFKSTHFVLTHSRDEIIRCYTIIKSSSRLFKLIFARVENRVCWTMQMFGHFQENFKFEIEIIDDNNNGNRLLIRQSCTPLSENKQLYIDDKQYGCFYLNQLQPLLKLSKITFKVRIFKDFNKR